MPRTTNKTPAVVTWTPLLVLLGLLALAIGAGVTVLTVVEHGTVARQTRIIRQLDRLTQALATKSELRDRQLCDQIRIDERVEPLLPNGSLIRAEIEKLRHDAKGSPPVNPCPRTVIRVGPTQQAHPSATPAAATTQTDSHATPDGPVPRPSQRAAPGRTHRPPPPAPPRPRPTVTRTVTPSPSACPPILCHLLG